MTEEAKTEVVEKTVDEKMDEVFDNYEKETPESTSDSKETTGKETEEIKDSEGTDLDKKSESKKETDEIPKEFHKNPAWQRILRERDEAKSKLTELESKGSLSAEDKKLLEDARTITTSREGIETLMKAQGFTQEAIDKRLAEAGHEVNSPENDVSLVCKSLNIDEKTLKPHQREDIEDFSKIARVIFKDMAGKLLSSELTPIKEHINETAHSRSAEKIMETIETTVSNEKILDFKKDIEPELNKYLDANPKATQEDMLVYFRELNHKLTLERLKTSKNQEVRDTKKIGLRQNTKTSATGKLLPAKTGEFHKDADAVLDTLGVT